MNSVYGYIRVSTKEQNTDRQHEALKEIILDTPLVSTGDTKLDYTINNMLIDFLSYIADKEREKIQGRVIEGLKNAKAKGIKLIDPIEFYLKTSRSIIVSGKIKK
ncbi:recombinase family protein [Clostridium estertheticum]|uniref:recombinase family protein n=1 Tax=Clostridium estertheticum TaxID=238834 RepID=UPI00139697B6|nr:recombinase family protein [Clostridium estertheticum]